MQPQSIRNAWYEARKSVPRLEEKKVRLYDLRHRALTMMAGYTNNLKVVMAAGGHTQVSTAMHYQHSTAGEELKVRQGIEAEYAATRNTGEEKTPKATEKPTTRPASADPSELEALAGTLEAMPLEAVQQCSEASRQISAPCAGMLHAGRQNRNAYGAIEGGRVMIDPRGGSHIRHAVSHFRNEYTHILH